MNENQMSMDEWIRQFLPRLGERSFSASRIGNVTLLSYFFWDDDRIETKFYTVECAFLSAFYRYGLMPSVLVVNKRTRCMDEFCGRYSIKIDIDPNLTGGVPRMNIDCNRNLYKRFDTDYVLIIQSDGMLVSPGLEEFVGKYDYVGAPWSAHTTWKKHLPYAKYLVGNGGLALRSKRICRCAAELYGRWFAKLPYSWFVSDDVFYARTLRCLFPSYRRDFVFPSPEIAGRFSIEGNRDYLPSDKPPVGFHAEMGFRNYCENFGLPLKELLP